MDDDRPGAAVVDQVFIILGEHPRIGRHGDGADLDRAKEAESELRRVRQNHQDAVLDLDAEILQRVAGAVNFSKTSW